VIKKSKHTRRWMQGFLLVLAVLAFILILKGREEPLTVEEKRAEGEFLEMTGLKVNAPEKLNSYQSVSGVLAIEYWLTQAGVPVYFVRVPTLPMVDVEVTFDAGAARNGRKGGLAYLTNTLLAEGAPNLSANQVAENFDKVGAQYHAQSQRDMATVQLRSLSDPKQLVPALETLSIILSQPTFPQEGFAREQQNMLSSLKQQAQMPNQMASRALFSALYVDHPYANWVLGDEAAVRGLTVEDVKRFHQEYYVAKNAVITIVGDLSAREANGIAEMITGKLPAGEPPPELPKVLDLKEKIARKVQFPSTQTHILIGEPGITEGDPDYYALYVGNQILGGGGLVSRIFNKVRNEHGLAYSAYSYFLPMRQRGPYILGCQTRNEQAEKAVNLIEDLLKEFIEKGPTEKELADAKQNLLGGYALQFDSNAAICQQVAHLGFYRLPLDHLNQFKAAVEKLTISDIQSAYQKRVSPDHVVVVSLGGENS